MTKKTKRKNSTGNNSDADQNSTAKNIMTIDMSSGNSQKKAKDISLPPREFSRANKVSLASNIAVLAGTGLTFFNRSKYLNLAGGAATAIGFTAKQIHDYLVNKKTREEIDQKETQLADSLGSDNPLPEIKKFTEHFGLEVDAKVKIAFAINTALQYASFGFSLANLITESKAKDIFPDYALLIVTVAAYGLDFLEQHYKSENLNRRVNQLEKIEETLASNSPTLRYS